MGKRCGPKNSLTVLSGSGMSGMATAMKMRTEMAAAGAVSMTNN